MFLSKIISKFAYCWIALTPFIPIVGYSQVPRIPLKIPKANAWGQITLPIPGKNTRTLSIDPELQEELSRYIRNHGNPIAAVILADVDTGHILAMAQGKDPKSWGSDKHSALYEGFPAASIFKIVPSAAALEIAKINPNKEISLTGGCANVNPRGTWMRDVKPDRYHRMSLERAFANSCNSFFAKLAINYTGLASLNHFAKEFGWNEQIDSDFYFPPSPIEFPKPSHSGAHSVGQYAAGFGMVGLSVVHGAWINLVIARNGVSSPIKIFADHDPLEQFSVPFTENRIISEQSSQKIKNMMERTVRNGTATSAYRGRKYYPIKRLAGGKTGTLTNKHPQGLTTWFVGMMPIKNPKVVVSAVVVNSDRWVIKGSNLAAEAFYLWHKKYYKKQNSIISQQKSFPLSTQPNKSG